jgi:D-alanyl-D-alanine carboxypeptidase
MIIGYYPTDRELTGNDGLSAMAVIQGESWRLRDLLYGMMLQSDNSAAQAVAEYLVGCESRDRNQGLECNARFAALMNERAQRPDLQLTDTSFRNPVGINVPGHRSSPRDLAKLARFALRNPVFAEIVKARVWEFNRTPGGVPVWNFRIRNDVRSHFLDAYPGANGVKSGTTVGAGHCYVGSATLFGKTVISVVLNSDAGQRFEDTKRLLDFGFDRLLAVRFTGNGFTAGTSGASVAIAASGPNRAVTAEQNANGHLRLSTWSVSAAGQVQQLSSSTDASGQVSEISVAPLTGNRVVTAAQDSLGNLKLTNWDLDAAAGGITRRASTTGPPGSQIRIRSLTGTRIVTAMISSGVLRLNSWALDQNNRWTQQSEIVTGEVVDMVSLTSYCLECNPDGPTHLFGLVTATRNVFEQYSLKVIAWSVSASGAITRTGHATNQIGAISPGWGGEIDVAFDAYANKVVTAGQDSQGELQLNSWEIDNGVVSRLGSGTNLAGRASSIRLSETGTASVLTAVRIPGSGRLKLIAWGLARDGSIRRLTDTGGEGEGPMAQVAICRIPGVTGGGFMAAVRNSQNRLQLIHIAVP